MELSSDSADAFSGGGFSSGLHFKPLSTLTIYSIILLHVALLPLPSSCSGGASNSDFFPSCLYEHVTTLDPFFVFSSSCLPSNTATPLSTTTLKAIFQVSTKPSSSFLLELRRMKSFSTFKNQRFSNVFEPNANPVMLGMVSLDDFVILEVCERRLRTRQLLNLCHKFLWQFAEGLVGVELGHVHVIMVLQLISRSLHSPLPPYCVAGLSPPRVTAFRRGLPAFRRRLPSQLLGCCHIANVNVKLDTVQLLGERPWKVANTRLVLEDGSIWMAKSFGASGTQVGEVVFNTSLTGTEYASDTWKINVFVA
ncbi:hypothetical protein TEA_002392 [Camellia sinensis var. sinensis]|uniref:Carbamoyl-phosphate synthase small subunit N-terminal domain-containing protein n=1 Tax=Camellia sinensis var. sinensis TaxID=542762 RepID=A0A4S4EV29_CAMSN|nr:hypothetical protein TEA_002392 [Camellia sinensis var. sinensis]